MSLLLMVLAACAVSPAFASVMISDGFESYTSGTVFTNTTTPWFTPWYPNGSATVVNTLAHSGSQSVYLDATSGNTYLQLGVPKPGPVDPQAGLSIYTAEAWVRPVQTNSGFAGLGLKGSVVKPDGYQGYVGEVGFGDTGRFYWTDGSSVPWPDTGVSYTANTWYDIKIVSDNTTQTWAFYVNDAAGNNLVTRSGLTYEIDFAAGDYPRRICSATGTESGAWYWDDVSLTAEAIPEPATIIVWSLLGLAGAGLGRWRRKRAA
jgi:hypothetical protein